MKIDPKKAGLTLRAMTYNIHSCVGMDGKAAPERIAGIIRNLEPDIVALQEVDKGMPQTRYQDQAVLLAEMLELDAYFFPVVKSGSQEYGLAVLSRFECIDVHYDWLPTLYPKLKLNLQKRGCIRATLQTPAGTVLIFNTHLGLYRLERRVQIRALAGDGWLGGLAPEAGVIFCGDLNAGAFSPVYLHLSRFLSDVQKGLKKPRTPKPTFPSRLPLLRIDHMFVSRNFRVIDVQVPRRVATRQASDHLPLLADLELKPVMSRG
jgi:endonuclease/exonuclease/phosphatase family metal-dependent hydrolase